MKFFLKLLVSLVSMVLLLLFSVQATWADNVVLYSPAEICALNQIDLKIASDFVRKLQSAVQTDNSSIISDMASYPVRINHGKKFEYIYNKKQLTRQYTDIFTPKFKKQILRQNAQAIFCNSKGAMIASGAIWFRADKHKTGFFAINRL